MDVGPSVRDTGPGADGEGRWHKAVDRSLWLSLMAVGLAIGVLVSLRAVDDASSYILGHELASEIASLGGEPSSEDLMTRTTESAGCLYGFRPPLATCWYAWAHPERPEYLALIAERVQADSGGSALAHLFIALPFWALAAFSLWKATRRRPPYRPSLERAQPDPARQAGRPVL